MSVFKRAEWHSGLTYRQSCEECKNVVTYTDHKLDFRPWYPNGFVYCPVCKTPLRHSETFAIDAPEATPANTEAENTSAKAPAAFCTQCGNKFNESDRFCAQCGAKR